MITLLLIAVLGNSPGDLHLAQELYDQAKYSEAYEALGPTCETALEQVRCEELRAAILVATSQRGLAIAAYARAILLKPDFELATNSSPKLVELVTEARHVAKDVLALELSGVSSNDSDTRWILTIEDSKAVRVPSPLVIETVTVYFGAPGAENFIPVLLNRVKDKWQSEMDIEATHKAGIGAYYYHVTLSNGASLRVGNEAQHRQVRVRRSFDSDQYGALTKGWPQGDTDGASAAGAVQPTPQWVWIVTASTIAAVVVGSVVAGAIILGKRREVGNPKPVEPQMQPLIRW